MIILPFLFIFVAILFILVLIILLKERVLSNRTSRVLSISYFLCSLGILLTLAPAIGLFFVHNNNLKNYPAFYYLLMGFVIIIGVSLAIFSLKSRR